jgi:ABC-type multidrug transport system fused ATPase/permease subunit
VHCDLVLSIFLKAGPISLESALMCVVQAAAARSMNPADACIASTLPLRLFSSSIPLQSRDEVLSKLLQLLRSYGLELPTTVPELETALASITEMAQRAGDTTAVPLSARATAAAVDPVRRMLAEGSKLWTDFDVDVEERFKQFQQTIPSASGTPVVFNHLNYEVTRAAGSTGEPTVGDVILKVGGAILCVPLLKRIIKGAEPANTKTVVRDASGVFKSGELTLVIGPPGCGKSSLLKLLAGLVKPDKSHR